jgi:hypothetical protein
MTITAMIRCGEPLIYGLNDHLGQGVASSSNGRFVAEEELHVSESRDMATRFASLPHTMRSRPSVPRVCDEWCSGRLGFLGCPEGFCPCDFCALYKAYLQQRPPH